MEFHVLEKKLNVLEKSWNFAGLQTGVGTMYLAAQVEVAGVLLAGLATGYVLGGASSVCMEGKKRWHSLISPPPTAEIETKYMSG